MQSTIWHFTIFKCRQMEALDAWLSSILHAGLHLNWRCSPVCVCLGKSLQLPHLSSPPPPLQRTSTDKIQVRVYTWVPGRAAVVFSQAGHKRMLWILCHYEWRIAPFTHFPGLSICNDSFLRKRDFEPRLKWVLWLFATAFLLVWPAHWGKLWGDTLIESQGRTVGSCVGLLPGAQQTLYIYFELFPRLLISFLLDGKHFLSKCKLSLCCKCKCDF